jgi:hypothetical protein
LAKQVFARVTEAERPRVLGALEAITSTYSAFRAATLMDVPTGVLYLAALWFISSDIGLAATVCAFVALALELTMSRVSMVASVVRDATRGRLVNHPPGAAEQETAIVEWMDSGVRLTRGAALREGVIVIANNSAYCFVIAVGALLVVNSTLPASALFGAGLLTSRSVAILLKVGSLRAELKRALPTMESIVRMLRERQPLPAGGAPAVQPPQSTPPAISVVAGRRA